MQKNFVTLAALTAMLSGCATAGADQYNEDPFEGFNRSMFAFNDKLDKAILEPTAKGYRAVTTENMREGVSNALANLREPVTFVNQLLQGDVGNAGETAGRFAMNSTLGIAGFIDATGSFGVKREKEDFGQTLGVWGVDSGPYLVMPLIGPTNPRSLTGMGVDTAFQPLNWAEFDGQTAFAATRTVGGAVSAREGAIELIDDLRSQQADPYTAVRRIFDQTQAAAIRNGAEDPNAYEDLPSFDEY